MSAGGTPPSGSMGLEKLAETLHCPLCLDFYEDPVALTCQHNFCRGCIKQVVPKRVGAHPHVLECPLCKRTMHLSCRDGVDNIPKNFERAGIVETFQAAEREHTRYVKSLRESVEESVTQNMVKQIDNMYSQAQEQENKQMRHSEQDRDGFGDAQPQPLSDEVFLSPSQSGFDTVVGEENITWGVHVPFQQEECSLTQHQQHQQRVRQLLQEQSKLQLKLEQQDVLDEFAKTQMLQPQEPDWRRQQTERWNELQSPSKVEYQRESQSASATSLPPIPNLQPQPEYQYPQSLPSYPLRPSTFESYPNPYQENATIRQPSFTSQTSETSCSECHFPASSHCENCLRFFCWQCLQDLHNTTRGLYAGHNVTELEATILQSEFGDKSSPLSSRGSSVSKPKQEPTLTLNTAMASLNVAGELASMGVSEQTYKIPYKCDINALRPGKNITVYGQPAQNCKRFHINFQLDNNSKTGDIALHFNPRFDKPMVVRNSRIKGQYGSEERRAPTFPFMVRRPFKLEFICLLDKFEVRVDNQYFISYAHRIHDLTSVKVFVIAGDVEISSVLGCS